MLQFVKVLEIDCFINQATAFISGRVSTTWPNQRITFSDGRKPSYLQTSLVIINKDFMKYPFLFQLCIFTIK